MTNYECNAACRHCLYACSPDRGGGYITREGAKEICGTLVKGGCLSVHIGGGEPFLDFDGLIALLEECSKAGIRVEYVETNGFWAVDEGQAKKMLQTLLKASADTLCISLDPFHAEYVSYGLPLKLAELCRSEGFGCFLWQERFLRTLSKANSNKPHDRAALEKQISPSYIIDTAQQYGIGIGGRAVNVELEYGKKQPLENLLTSRGGRRACNLLSTDHFHVDLHGNFIPPGCTGIAVPLAELLDGLEEGKYPVFEAIVSSGLLGLLKYAESLGFVADEEYTSACMLCFFIRKWLAENTACAELDTEHYKASFEYY